ncbi:MAG: cysteine desulfurase family protein [Candidatus Aenigmarchaeota archaeon]|nr:cysteine desulfurase family protein [Candidatus Aenigmarchaeota archaeon]
MKTSRIVYLDNGKTTKVDPVVLAEMKKYFLRYYAAPSSTEYGHSFGMKAREALIQAKLAIAKKINADQAEIIFTSGEVENDNLAIKGACFAHDLKDGRNRIITTKIERKPVLDIFRMLEGMGCYKADYVNVDREGFVKFDELEKTISDKTLLVAVQHANHEIGTIQDIARIGELCRKRGVIFYVDASQSFTKAPIDVKKMNVDLMSLSSDKNHGPKGVAALYVRNGVRIQRLFEGGESPEDIRPSGIPNVPAIMGFAKAVELANEKQNAQMRKMRNYLIANLLKIPGTQLNGPKNQRLCSNVNVSFKFIEGESLLMHLDSKGIVATTGSACFSTNLQPSHVILALSLAHEDAHGSLRLTLSRYNNMQEMSYVVTSAKEVVKRLREISPFSK